MTTEEEVTKVVNAADTIDSTNDKDVTENNKGGPNPKGDLLEPKPETTFNDTQLLINGDSLKKVDHEDVVEVKEPTPEDVQTIEPVIPSPEPEQIQVEDAVAVEDAATPQKDVEEPALTVPIVESVAEPEEIVTAIVEEAEAPPAEEHHEVAVPADESTEPTIPATSIDLPDADVLPSQSAPIVEPEPQPESLPEPATEFIPEAASSAPVDAVISEDEATNVEEVEATPVVAVVEEDPTPVVEDAVVTVVATSVDETCHSQDDVPQQDATPSLPETKEESTTSEAIEESSAPETIEESLVPETIEESPAPEIIEESPIPESVEEVIEAAPTEPEEVEPEVQLTPEVASVSPEVPTATEQAIEPEPTTTDVTPEVPSVPVDIPEEVHEEPELKAEVLPKVPNDKVEVESEILEPFNSHADSELEEQVSDPSEGIVVVDDAPADTLQEPVHDVKEEPSSDEPREQPEEVAATEEAPILAVEPEVVNTAPIEEPAPEPKQEPTPLLDAHDEVLMSTPVMLAESTEICFTLPSLEGDQNAVEESIICSASDDVEEIVQTTELAEPVAEVVVVEESGPVPPTAIEELPAPEVTVVIEDKPEEVVDDISKADETSAEEPSRDLTEVLPPEIVVEEDRGPAEPTQAQTSDDGLIIESAASVNPALTIVDNAGESEKTETQVVEEKVVPDVERPKSPWTPSYSVTTQGPGVTSVDVPEEEDDQKTDADSPVDVEADKVIEESTGNGAAIVASTETPVDTLSTSAEELSKSGSWPKSYSVSSQGASPMHAPQKTDDDDVKPIESAPQEEAITAPVVEEAIAASVVEEAITQVTENGQVETKAEEVAIDSKPEEEAAVAVTAETTPKEAQEQVVEAPAEVSPEETSQPQEIVEPQARAAYKQTPTRQFFANWVALADPNHDDTSSIHSTETGSETVFIPKLQVEGKTAAPAPTEVPGRPWTPSYSVLRQGSTEVLAPQEPAPEVPQAPEAAPERPWTPSYSVLRQGTSPGLPAKELDNEAVPAANLDADVVVPTAAEHEEEPDLEVRSFAEQEPKWTPSYSVSQQGTSALATPPSQTNELTPEEQLAEPDETPERPWTPSYSVIKQGSLPATPKKQDGEASERPWTPSYSVLKQGSLTPKKGDEAPVTDVFSAESDRQAFPTSEAVEDGPKVSDKPSLSRLAPLDEDKPVETSAPAQIDTFSPANGRARLESTTSSRFFPGGWFSSSPKSPEENGASLDHANGVFSKATTNGVTSPVIEAPANTPVDGVEDSPKRTRWCVVM